MGKYFEKYPADRKRIFLVTKSHAWTTEGMSEDLNLSLKRMQTNYMEKCAQTGIGLTAMKSQGGSQVKTDSEKELG